MCLLFEGGFVLNYVFVVYYIYFCEIFVVDVVFYFGIYGVLEFMFGKYIGLLGSCWLDCFLGSLLNYYFYVVNNFLEGLIVKCWFVVIFIFYLILLIIEVGFYKGFYSLKVSLDQYCSLVLDVGVE